jgi:F-type H+-transporting ATPase subunit alpha
MEIKAEEISQIIKDQIKGFDAKVDLNETGVVLSAGDGIARVYGLEKVKAMELVEFPGGILGLALNLESDNVGIAILGDDGIHSNSGFTDLTVTDDQLPLTPAHRGHAVYGLGPGVTGFMH